MKQPPHLKLINSRLLPEHRISIHCGSKVSTEIFHSADVPDGEIHICDKYRTLLKIDLNAGTISTVCKPEEKEKKK